MLLSAEQEWITLEATKQAGMTIHAFWRSHLDSDVILALRGAAQIAQKAVKS